MEPRVTRETVELGRVGRKPLGQSATILRGNADYPVPFLPGVSFDLAISWYGERAASRDNLASVDPYAMIDLGARYRFKLGRSPATFRVQTQNATNTFACSIVGSNSYGLMDKRRFTASLAMDLKRSGIVLKLISKRGRFCDTSSRSAKPRYGQRSGYAAAPKSIPSEWRLFGSSKVRSTVQLEGTMPPFLVIRRCQSEWQRIC